MAKEYQKPFLVSIKISKIFLAYFVVRYTNNDYMKNSFKRCSVCGIVKPISDFHFMKNKYYRKECNHCVNTLLAKEYRKNAKKRLSGKYKNFKKCKKCKKVKNIKMFDKYPQIGHPGEYYQSYCRPCSRKLKKERQEKNRQWITDQYIFAYFFKGSKLKFEDVPKEFFEAKRNQIKIKRELRKKKGSINANIKC